jgi:hypothetical protein
LQFSDISPRKSSTVTWGKYEITVSKRFLSVRWQLCPIRPRAQFVGNCVVYWTHLIIVHELVRSRLRPTDSEHSEFWKESDVILLTLGSYSLGVIHLRNLSRDDPRSRDFWIFEPFFFLSMFVD